jgi:hypothetical protein
VSSRQTAPAHFALAVTGEVVEHRDVMRPVPEPSSDDNGIERARAFGARALRDFRPFVLRWLPPAAARLSSERPQRRARSRAGSRAVRS